MSTEESVPGERLSFSVVREDWSQYRLTDTGTLVKIKVSMSDIIDTGRRKGKMHELKFEAKNVFFKEPSPDDKGEPSGDTKISAEDTIQDLQFERISEPVNIYDVHDKLLLLVRPKLESIRKTRKFDSNGDRIYHYNVLCAINVVGYPT